MHKGFYRYKGDLCIRIHSLISVPRGYKICVEYFDKRTGAYYGNSYGLKRWVLMPYDSVKNWEYFYPNWM